jgi:hypothetical protein
MRCERGCDACSSKQKRHVQVRQYPSLAAPHDSVQRVVSHLCGPTVISLLDSPHGHDASCYPHAHIVCALTIEPEKDGFRNAKGNARLYCTCSSSNAISWPFFVSMPAKRSNLSPPEPEMRALRMSHVNYCHESRCPPSDSSGSATAR